MRIHFNRYSETIPHDEAKANLLATCFADETSNLLTNASLCKQWYIVSNNKVRVVSLPTAYRHDNTYIYLAQDGDDLTHLELVSIPQAAPTSWFLALLPEAVATTLGVKTSPTPLATLTNDQGDPIMPADIGFPEPGASPRLASIPLICPVYPGQHAFTDLPPLPCPPSEQLLQEAPQLAAWLTALNWVKTHNNGNPITPTTCPFRYTDFNLTNLPPPATTIQTTLTEIRRDTAPGRLFKAIWAGETARAQPNTPTPPTTAQPDLAQILQGLGTTIGTSLQHNSNKHDKEREQEASEVAIQWRLLFARHTPTDPNNPANATIDIPELSEEFLAVLTATSDKLAQRRLKDGLNETKNHLRPNTHFLNVAYRHRPDLINKLFTNSIRNFRLASNPFTQASIRDHFGVPHLVPPDEQQLEYSKFVAYGASCIRQEYAGEDKTKMKQKQDYLFHQGVLTSPADLYATLGAFWILTHFILKEPLPTAYTEMPIVWSQLFTYMDAWRTDSGETFFSTNRHYDTLLYHLLSDMHTIMSSFVLVSKTSAYKHALRHNLPVAPRGYLQAINISENTTSRLMNILHTGTISTFADQALLHTLMNPKAREKKDKQPEANQTPTTPEKTETKRPRDSTPITPDEPTSKRRSNPTQADINKYKLKGLLTYTGPNDKPPPRFTDYVTHPKTKQATSVCACFSTKGFYCKQGTECRMLHLTKLSDLTDKDRDKFKQWVETHEHLQFTNTSDGQ